MTEDKILLPTTLSDTQWCCLGYNVVGTNTGTNTNAMRLEPILHLECYSTNHQGNLCMKQAFE
jgi:hypothetical protein